jgi:hypothetical protein
MSSPTVPDIVPIAYKFVGGTDTWLVTKYGLKYKCVFPMYAPIEDEV